MIITEVIEKLKEAFREKLEDIRYGIKFAGSLLDNTRGEGYIPDFVLRDLARLFLPAVLKMYATDEGKAELTARAEEMKKNGQPEQQHKPEKKERKTKDCG